MEFFGDSSYACWLFTKLVFFELTEAYVLSTIALLVLFIADEYSVVLLYSRDCRARASNCSV